MTVEFTFTVWHLLGFSDEAQVEEGFLSFIIWLLQCVHLEFSDSCLYITLHTATPTLVL